MLYSREANASFLARTVDLAASGPAADAPRSGDQCVRRRRGIGRPDAARLQPGARAVVDHGPAALLRGAGGRPAPAGRPARRLGAISPPRDRDRGLAGSLLRSARVRRAALAD